MVYGKNDLDAELRIVNGPPKTIRCFVRDCQQMLRPPTRRGGGDVCPDHGIRCHSSGTYSYEDVRRNVIIDAEILATRVVGHPAKYESDRLHLENSEDALTWNVFRSLQKAGQLHKAASLVSGSSSTVEPTLYLWGLCLTGDTFEPWDLLIEARNKFESNLPVERPLTEPDIALYLPGRYLILIEAKFTSPNPVYKDGPRKDSKSLTKAELLDIYRDPSLRILSGVKAAAAKQVHYQLWRNLIFAEWMAGQGESGTQGFLGSLTRKGHEQASSREFGQLLSDGFQNRFRHISWEGLIEACCHESPRIKYITAYMQHKTASRVPAFDFQST